MEKKRNTPQTINVENKNWYIHQASPRVLAVVSWECREPGRKRDAARQSQLVVGERNYRRHGQKISPGHKWAKCVSVVISWPRLRWRMTSRQRESQRNTAAVRIDRSSR